MINSNCSCLIIYIFTIFLNIFSKKEGLQLATSQKFKSQKTAFYILLLYIACLLSSLLLLIPSIRNLCLEFINADGYEAGVILAAWWQTVTFGITFLLCLLIISRNKNFWNIFKGEKSSFPVAIGWGILGFFMVLFGQMIGANIELALGIDYESENTETILKITEIAPIMILSTVVFGPILEEYVFRRVIFGSLIQTQNFWIAALLSGIFFAIIHLDFAHILVYTISGFIFAFLYYKTKRIITSIIAHMMLNGFATVSALYSDEIKKMIEQFIFYLF